MPYEKLDVEKFLKGAIRVKANIKLKKNECPKCKSTIIKCNCW